MTLRNNWIHEDVVQAKDMNNIANAVNNVTNVVNRLEQVLETGGKEPPAPIQPPEPPLRNNWSSQDIVQPRDLNDIANVVNDVVSVASRLERILKGGDEKLPQLPSEIVTYGVQIDLSNPNPYTSVTYTDDAIGMIGGSEAWDSLPIFRDIRPCLFSAGKVVGYLNPNNYAEWAEDQDLTGLPAAPDITTGNGGDVMVEFPKLGWRFNRYGNVLTVQITNHPNAGAQGFRYYGHTRFVEGDRDFLYVGAYSGFRLGTRLRSLSGRVPVSLNLGDFRSAAHLNGPGYDQQMFYSVTLLQILYLIRFKNLDSQSALGNGRTNATTFQATGTANTSGMNWGTHANMTDIVKCLGVEDLWGNVNELVDGFRFDLDLTISTAFTEFNTTTAFTPRGKSPSTGTISGWITDVQGTNEMGFIPSNTQGGSGTTFFSDVGNLWATRFVLFGGARNVTTNAGIFSLNMGNASATVGGRLTYL